MNDETYEENRPLLEEPGHRQLLETITPEEVQEAQKLLAPFVKEYKLAGVEKVAVLAVPARRQTGTAGDSLRHQPQEPRQRHDRRELCQETPRLHGGGAALWKSEH